MDEWAGSSQEVHGHAGPLRGSSCLFYRNAPGQGLAQSRPCPSLCVWTDVRPQLALSPHQAVSVEEKAQGSSLKPPSLGHLVQALPRGPLLSVGLFSEHRPPRG